MSNRRELIAALARGLAEGTAVRIAFTDSTWAWQPQTRTLHVGTEHLETLPLEAALGLVAHEIGHCAISRYLDVAAAFRPVRLHSGLWLNILNTLEDPRVESWIVRDFTGTAPWLDTLHAAMLESDWPPPPEVPGSQVLLLAHLREWMRGWVAEPGLAPEVTRLLDATRTLRRTYAETVPVVQGLDRVPREAAVVASALAAMPLAARFGTVVAQLWHAEVATLAAELGVDEALFNQAHEAVKTKNLAQAWDVLRQATGLEPVCPEPNSFLELATELRLLIDRGQVPSLPMRRTLVGRVKGAPRPGQCTTGHVPEANMDTRLPPRQALLTQLRLELAKVFPPSSAPAWTRDHPSGRRLDLRRTLQAEADPRHNAHLWQRRGQPTRADAAVLLLVDLSGSMASEGRIGAAVLATSVCAQALREWGIPTAIVGFQDEVVPIAGFDEPWTPGLAQRIEAMALEVHGTRPGGHNRPLHNDDGPCLRVAAAQLLRRGELTRVLLVLSDGRPCGGSGARELHAAIADLQRLPRLTLAGLGLGQGTRHVEQFYPDAQGDIPIDVFPARLAATLVRRLTPGRPGRVRQATQVAHAE